MAASPTSAGPGYQLINTLYNVCAVPSGVFSTVGGVQYRGGYYEYRGGVQYRGGIS